MRAGGHRCRSTFALIEPRGRASRGADGKRGTFASARRLRDDGVVLAHLLDGAPLAALHFPLRLVGASLAKEEWLGAVDSVIMRVPRGPTPTWPTRRTP